MLPQFYNIPPSPKLDMTVDGNKVVFKGYHVTSKILKETLGVDNELYWKTKFYAFIDFTNIDVVIALLRKIPTKEPIELLISLVDIVEQKYNAEFLKLINEMKITHLCITGMRCKDEMFVVNQWVKMLVLKDWDHVDLKVPARVTANNDANLVLLDLTNSNIGDQEITSMVIPFVNVSPSLTKLILRKSIDRDRYHGYWSLGGANSYNYGNNRITDEGAKALLKNCTKIKELDLFGNQVTTLNLGPFFTGPTSLISLDIRWGGIFDMTSLTQVRGYDYHENKYYFLSVIDQLKVLKLHIGDYGSMKPNYDIFKALLDLIPRTKLEEVFVASQLFKLKNFKVDTLDKIFDYSNNKDIVGMHRDAKYMSQNTMVVRMDLMQLFVISPNLHTFILNGWRVINPICNDVINKLTHVMVVLKDNTKLDKLIKSIMKSTDPRIFIPNQTDEFFTELIL